VTFAFLARTRLGLLDMKLELVPVPVTDVDRAKAFYVDQVGFHADHDGNTWSVQQIPVRS